MAGMASIMPLIMSQPSESSSAKQADGTGVWMVDWRWLWPNQGNGRSFLRLLDLKRRWEVELIGTSFYDLISLFQALPKILLSFVIVTVVLGTLLFVRLVRIKQERVLKRLVTCSSLCWGSRRLKDPQSGWIVWSDVMVSPLGSHRMGNSL